MLPCQLLCASAAAYDVLSAGTLPLTNPNVQNAGFTQPPVTFVGGSGNPKVNACLVGTAGNAVIVAFRGTLSGFSRNMTDDWSIFLDWIQDFLAEPVEVEGFPGEVHDGFQKAFATIWDDAADEMQKQMAAVGAGAGLYTTGHSKGGPLANYAAWSASQGSIPFSPTCITFAAPRAGDQDFADDYNANPNITSTRYEYQDDFVPHVPPRSLLIAALAALPNLPDRAKRVLQQVAGWNYVSVGELEFINWNDQMVNPKTSWDKLVLDGDRIRHLVAMVSTCQFRHIGDDHSLTGGYCANICPPGTCP